jgi:hypothetical protein
VLDGRAHPLVATPVQVDEPVDGVPPLDGDRAVDGVAQVLRQLPVDVARDHEAPVDVLLLLGPHLRHLGDDTVMDPAVELVEGDVAVAVHITGAGTDRLDEVPGEHRPGAGARDRVALEGVLGRVRRCQHHAALALELLQCVDGGIALRGVARREGAAVAAVEDQHLAAGGAGVHRVADVRGRQTGEQQRVVTGVLHGQVEPPLVVLEAVPREVQERQVLVSAGAVEVPDRLADDLERLVEEDRHLEARDVRVPQDLGEPLGVVGRRGQLAQAFVLIGVGRHEKRLALRRHGGHAGWRGPTNAARSRSSAIRSRR